MTEQTNLDFVTLFENDEVKVISMRGEIRVDFFHHGREQRQSFTIKHTQEGIEVMAHGSLGIFPSSGNVIDLVSREWK